jgi:NAD(P)-dependent dehydrogenase (short-subunit alcohol dehydrogenase family)
MNRRVLITAAASGIGKEIAKAFYDNGDKVFICDIDEEALEEFSREMPEAITTVCDVSNRNDVEKMIAYGAEHLGGFDVLVNNAGIGGPTAPVEEIDPDAWEKVMQVDINGTFNVTRLIIPYLKNSGSGVIINMSSVAGRFGYENRSPYSTAKWGLIGFTKTLSIELGPHNIRANAILPGAVDGPRIQRVLKGRAESNGTSVEEETEKAMKVQSIKRFVDPKDIAQLALFLASDAAKSISGQMLPIDNDMQAASLPSSA